MNTPQAVKAIRERRERREQWTRLMEAVNEDWKPSRPRLVNPEQQHPALQAPMLMQKWWKVNA